MNWSNTVNRKIVSCRMCPRLVQWREQVARNRKPEYRCWEYWGRPVPGLGDPQARMLVMGLAPAAHGANRTGRMFTGDQSGRWLYRALHKAGFANQPGWERPDDGLVLTDCYISTVCHCAPPGNKPLPVELAACNQYLREELDGLRNLRVVVCLGRIAFTVWHKTRGVSPVPSFVPGRCYDGDPITVVASYHPSRQNTNTGRLTELMLDAVFGEAKRVLAQAG